MIDWLILLILNYQCIIVGLRVENKKHQLAKNQPIDCKFATEIGSNTWKYKLKEVRGPHAHCSLHSTNPSKTLTLSLSETFPLSGEMSGVAPDSGENREGQLVPYSEEVDRPVVYPLRHGVKPPISRLAISWSRGSSLRVSVFRKQSSNGDSGDEFEGKVVEVRLGNGDGEISDAEWRKVSYGSISPFALLQSRRNSISSLSKMTLNTSPYHVEW